MNNKSKTPIPPPPPSKDNNHSEKPHSPTSKTAKQSQSNIHKQLQFIKANRNHFHLNASRNININNPTHKPKHLDYQCPCANRTSSPSKITIHHHINVKTAIQMCLSNKIQQQRQPTNTAQ
jgi:hypothetical protein